MYIIAGLFEKLFGKKKKATVPQTASVSNVSPSSALKSLVEEERAEDAKIAAEFAEEIIPVPQIPNSDDETIAHTKTTQENEVNDENASAGLAYEKTSDNTCKITGIGSLILNLDR